MLNVKMKQIKNTSAVRVASAALAAFVLLFSFSVSSFAYTDTSSNGVDFELQPIPIVASFSESNISNYGLNVGTSSYPYYVASIYDDVYVFVASTYLYFVCPNSGNYAGSYRYSGGSMGISTNAINSFNSASSLYYTRFTLASPFTSSDFSWNCPKFSSDSDGFAAVLDWIANPPPGPADPHPVSFSLQAGYVAFVDISNLSGVSSSLSTSVFGSAEWSPRVTDQAIGVLSSLPSSFSIPISGTTRISWTGTGSKNVLGQYKNFAYSYNASSAGGSSYLCIVNPLQASQSGQLTAMASMPSSRNNPITVSISSARSVKIYSLTATMSLGSGNLDTESDGNTWSGSADENGQWSFTNDQTGSPTDIDSLPVGGGNDPIIGETSINDWLQEIANSIKGFFSGAIGAVTTLVSAGSDFMHQLMGLYSWLPAPVYAVLTSALILVITIGVIKVFI